MPRIPTKCHGKVSTIMPTNHVHSWARINRQLILGWRTLFFQEGEYQPNPTKSAEWNRGAYLVQGLGHC
jgi:hypothetical protein